VSDYSFVFTTETLIDELIMLPLNAKEESQLETCLLDSESPMNSLWFLLLYHFKHGNTEKMSVLYSKYKESPKVTLLNARFKELIEGGAQ
jgi:hypothetical protein